MLWNIEHQIGDILASLVFSRNATNILARNGGFIDMLPKNVRAAIDWMQCEYLERFFTWAVSCFDRKRNSSEIKQFHLIQLRFRQTTWVQTMGLRLISRRAINCSPFMIKFEWYDKLCYYERFQEWVSACQHAVFHVKIDWIQTEFICYFEQFLFSLLSTQMTKGQQQPSFIDTWYIRMLFNPINVARYSLEDSWKTEFA